MSARTIRTRKDDDGVSLPQTDESRDEDPGGPGATVPQVEGYPSRLSCFLGGNIRLARLRRGTSQADLARAVGIEVSQLESYEAGLEKVGSSVLWLIACALETTLGSLFDAGTFTG